VSSHQPESLVGRRALFHSSLLFDEELLAFAKFKRSGHEHDEKNGDQSFLNHAGAKVFGKASRFTKFPSNLDVSQRRTLSEVGFVLRCRGVFCVPCSSWGSFLNPISMLLIMMPVLYPSLGMMGIDPEFGSPSYLSS